MKFTNFEVFFHFCVYYKAPDGKTYSVVIHADDEWDAYGIFKNTKFNNYNGSDCHIIGCEMI